MKTFEHHLMVEEFRRFDGSPIIGLQPCEHTENCSKRYSNFNEMCGGFMVVVEYAGDTTGSPECAFWDSHRNTIIPKDYVK